MPTPLSDHPVTYILFYYGLKAAVVIERLPGDSIYTDGYGRWEC